MPDDRQRPRSYHDRPQQGGPGPRTGGYVPRSGPTGPPRSGFVGSRPGGPSLDSPVSVRLREGDREVEVHGSPGFCRQVLEDLPTVFARLRGEGGRAAAVALPSPPRSAAPAAVDVVTPAAAPDAVAAASSARAANGHRAASDDPAVLDEAVMKVLRSARTPMTIAELRRRLPDGVSGQAVRRVLERAPDRVVNVGGKPAAYRAR